MLVRTSPALTTRAAVASLTAPAAAPVKEVRADTGKEGDYSLSVQTILPSSTSRADWAVESVETLVTLLTAVAASVKLSPITELVRTRTMLLMKTEAEVSVPSVRSPAWTASMTVMTEAMLAMLACNAVTAAS